MNKTMYFFERFQGFFVSRPRFAMKLLLNIELHCNRYVVKHHTRKVELLVVVPLSLNPVSDAKHEKNFPLYSDMTLIFDLNLFLK